MIYILISIQRNNFLFRFCGNSWAPSLKGSDGGQLSDFIDGLGPGQLVGRQVLGAPSLGDIQLSMCYQKGYLEVEVIRARGLQAKPNCKVLPGEWSHAIG